MKQVVEWTPRPARPPHDIADQTTEFVGRGWALERICQWLSAGQGRVLVVSAGPGAGKTALAARLVLMARGEANAPKVARPPIIHAAHFCRWGYIESIAPVQVLAQLATQLASSVPGYAEVLASVSSGGSVQITIGQQSVKHVSDGASVTMTQIGQVTIAERSHRQAFDLVLRKPLRMLRDNGKLPRGVVILFDGVDESVEGVSEPTLVSTFASEMDNPVPGLRLVLCTRAEPVVSRLATHVDKHFDLTVDEPPAAGDLHNYSYHRLQPMPERPRRRLAQRIAKASEGSFLYAYHVTEDILSTRPSPADMVSLRMPEALSEVYRRFLDREIGADRSVWSHRFRPVLGALIQARGDGLTRDQLIAITGLPASAVDDTLTICAPYLAGDPVRGLRPFHQSLRDYLRGPGPHHIYPAEASWKILTGLAPMHAGKIRWDQAGPYLLLHGPEYAGDADRADEVLTDAEFLVHAEPITLLPLLDKACEEDAALAASVYAASSDWHQYLEPDARRRALAIDAAAFGARDLASRLAQPLRWLPTWTSGVNVHKGLSKTGFFLGYNPGPRARQIIRLGSRWVLLAHDPGGRHGELQVWDLTTGRPVGRSFADDVTAVATTQLHRRTVAVSGGRDGKLIVWNLASRQPLDLPLQGSGEVIAVSVPRRADWARRRRAGWA